MIRKPPTPLGRGTPLGTALVVAGSSGTGKTTLVRGLRSPEWRPRVVVPCRFVTRIERADDDPAENLYVNEMEFCERLDAGLISPAWKRTLKTGETRRYGFAAVDDADPRIRVYSANTALLRTGRQTLLTGLGRTTVVIVKADGRRRTQRLGRKDMPALERAIRLGERAEPLLSGPWDVRVIDTTDLSPGEGQQALQAIINALSRR